MSTESSVELNYKLASGRMLPMGTFTYGARDDDYVEFHNEYFLNTWCEKNLESLPENHYRYWLPFEKVHEFIKLCNDALRFEFTNTNRKKLNEMFPFIPEMGEFAAERCGITLKDNKVTYTPDFFAMLRKVKDKLAPVLSEDGNEDAILTFYIC